MRHRNINPKLGRTTAHRKALIRNMVTALLRDERINTTIPKAKETRRWAERVITMAKRGNLHARRLAARYVRDAEVLKKLFDVVAPRYATRPGGYTRILKTGPRAGDNAPMSILELVGSEYVAAVAEEPVADAGKKAKAPRGEKKEKSLTPKSKAPRPEKKAAPKTKTPLKGGSKIGPKKAGRSSSGGKSGSS